ncbi:MAG TPA: helix-turn-helix transcriptional regulator [Puia sp.]|nr:helix-turn-helix transcriptional regulator [Puia sp.]
MTVETILKDLDLPFSKVVLGEVDLVNDLSAIQLKEIDKAFVKLGFELIETRVNKIIEDIKKRVIAYVQEGIPDRKRRLSSFITSALHYDYSYLSDLFSSIEGLTIEKYFIIQRIEKVKELIVYDQLSLTEIAYQTGFSSVHHLSGQFKKQTGINASHFKKIGAARRKSIDKA